MAISWTIWPRRWAPTSCQASASTGPCGWTRWASFCARGFPGRWTPISRRPRRRRASGTSSEAKLGAAPWRTPRRARCGAGAAARHRTGRGGASCRSLQGRTRGRRSPISCCRGPNIAGSYAASSGSTARPIAKSATTCWPPTCGPSTCCGASLPSSAPRISTPPRSDRWLRITMYRGAPYPDELHARPEDAWLHHGGASTLRAAE